MSNSQSVDSSTPSTSETQKMLTPPTSDVQIVSIVLHFQYLKLKKRLQTFSMGNPFSPRCSGKPLDRHLAASIFLLGILSDLFVNIDFPGFPCPGDLQASWGAPPALSPHLFSLMILHLQHLKFKNYMFP